MTHPASHSLFWHRAHSRFRALVKLLFWAVVAETAGVGLLTWRLDRGLGRWVPIGTESKPDQKVMPCQKARQHLVDGGLSPAQPPWSAPQSKPGQNFCSCARSGTLLGWGMGGWGHLARVVPSWQDRGGWWSAFILAEHCTVAKEAL